MRIISGMRRGMKLKAPDGMDTRPTTDRVKESLFNIIQFAIPAESVLDLFSGSGALGIEALSRGSERCVFVDGGRAPAVITKENIASADFEEKSVVEVCEALDFLQRCSCDFDLIFLDPPYNKGLLEPVIKTVSERGLLRKDGIIAVESERDGEKVPDTYYPVRKSVSYGKTTITILQG